MVDHQRYGQKNGKGYLRVLADKHGKPKKTVYPETYKLIGRWWLSGWSSTGRRSSPA